jgi:hypothetical protein
VSTGVDTPFVELAPGIEAYYPLGLSPYGASTAILLSSPEAQQLARQWIRRVRIGSLLLIPIVLTVPRILIFWPFAVICDVSFFHAAQHVLVRRARSMGNSIPADLSMRICAETLGSARLSRIKWQLACSGIFIACFAAICAALGPANWMNVVSVLMSVLPFAIQNYCMARRLELLLAHAEWDSATAV